MTIEYFPGNQYDIAIALQSAQGVAATDSQFRSFVAAGGLNPIKESTPIEETSDDRLLSDDYVSGVRGEGGPQLIARPNILGLLLYGALGAKDVAGVGDPYTHTFTEAERLPYFTCWSRLGDDVDGMFTKYIDCKIGQLVLESAANGLLMVTPTILGLSPRHADAAEATADIEAAGTAFLHADGSGALKVETVADVTVESQTLTINNTATNQTGDSVEGYAITEGRLDITHDITVLAQDFDLLRRYIYGSASPADGAAPDRNVLRLTGGIDFKWTIPGTPERSLRIQEPTVVAVPNAIDPNVNGDALKRTFQTRLRRPTSGAAITATLKNGHASYPAAS